MEALKITNANAGFANFCIALGIKFAYSNGTFFVFGTSDEDKFREYCKSNGYVKWESMEISQCEFDSGSNIYNKV